jgi:hypothetical protein
LRKLTIVTVKQDGFSEMSPAITASIHSRTTTKGASDEFEQSVFEVSRRAMLSAFAALPTLPVLFPASALADIAGDPLPSWNDTASKKAITTFVERVTKQGSPDLVPEAERIATFDNDGTLWAEQPIYFQLAFALDRVKVLAEQHLEWKDKEPFASLLKGDLKGALAGGEAAIFQIVTVTHSGVTTVEFEKISRDWITTAKHPQTGKLCAEMVYQPMLELLAYLRGNGFKTFIVSGGGIDFIGSSPSGSTAFRPSRSSAAAASWISKCATASLSS